MKNVWLHATCPKVTVTHSLLAEDLHLTHRDLTRKKTVMEETVPFKPGCGGLRRSQTLLMVLQMLLVLET